MGRNAAIDVVIIGGGPAGSTVATLLSRKGFRVVVLEKERFPREHVGESLLPFCYPIFKDLGVLPEMERRYVRKPGVRFVDVDGSTQTTWCFGHVIKDESHLSFHVLRAEFDELLLDNAARHGAQVHEGTRVTRVDLGSGNGHGPGALVEAVGPRGGNQSYRARFVVDASGRDTFLASRMKTKVAHDALDRAAISTHWGGAAYEGGIDEGLLQIVYLGGEDKLGWIWAIPVGTDRLSVGTVMTHSHLRRERDRLTKAGSKDWKRDLYLQELFNSPFIRGILEKGRMIMPLMFNGDYSYAVTTKYGDAFALVGDASAFIDPIFASGVYLSMNSARLLADAVTVRLTEGGPQADRAFAHTYKQIEGAYKLVDRAIRNFYNPKSINWAQLGSASDEIHKHHADAMAVAHYLLAGDFFERHDQYLRFLKLLEDPTIMDRYRSFVIERPEFHGASCSTSRTAVFNALLAEYEAKRVRKLRWRELAKKAPEPVATR
jgi:flavin-dependent dehydrogenase